MIDVKNGAVIIGMEGGEIFLRDVRVRKPGDGAFAGGRGEALDLIAETAGWEIGAAADLAGRKFFPSAGLLPR